MTVLREMVTDRQRERNCGSKTNGETDGEKESETEGETESETVPLLQ